MEILTELELTGRYKWEGFFWKTLYVEAWFNYYSYDVDRMVFTDIVRRFRKANKTEIKEHLNNTTIK